MSAEQILETYLNLIRSERAQFKTQNEDSFCKQYKLSGKAKKEVKAVASNMREKVLLRDSMKSRIMSKIASIGKNVKLMQRSKPKD